MTLKEVQEGWHNGTLSMAEAVSGFAQATLNGGIEQVPEMMREDVECVQAALRRGETFSLKAN